MRCSYVHMYIPLKSHAPAIIFSKDLFVWWFTWQVALRKCHIIFIFAALFVHFVSDLLIFVILCQLMRQSRYFGPRRRRRRVRKANVGIEWLGQVLRVLSPHSFVSWPASLLYSRAELQLHICSHAKKWKVTGLSWARNPNLIYRRHFFLDLSHPNLHPSLSISAFGPLGNLLFLCPAPLHLIGIVVVLVAGPWLMATEHFIPFFAGNKNIFFFGHKIMNNMKEKYLPQPRSFFFSFFWKTENALSARFPLFITFLPPQRRRQRDN